MHVEFSTNDRISAGDGAGAGEKVALAVIVVARHHRAVQAEQMKQQLSAAGFEAEFTDVTANVAEACRIDSSRRRELIERQVPLIGRLLFGRQLENYAGVEGSDKYRQFAERHRAYLMTAAVRR